MVKKCSKNEPYIFTIHFQSAGALEVSANSDFDRRVLTHIFISFCCVYVRNWGNKSQSFTHNAHKLCDLFATNFTTDPLILVVEKENIKMANKRSAPSINSKPAKKRKIMVVDFHPKDYIKLCAEICAKFNEKAGFLEFLNKADWTTSVSL